MTFLIAETPSGWHVETVSRTKMKARIEAMAGGGCGWYRRIFVARVERTIDPDTIVQRRNARLKPPTAKE